MNAMGHTEKVLFENGPPHGLQRRLGFVSEHGFTIVHRACSIVLVTWVPLVVLAAAQSVLCGSGAFTALLGDAAASARYLLAAPLFVFAEIECGRRLDSIIGHFSNADLVDADDLKQFNTLVTSTGHLVNSASAEFAIIVAAYSLVALVVPSQHFDQFPTWHITGGIEPVLSAAGWWHVLVSLPLLLALIFGWMWRLFLWNRLLWGISRLKLRLVASHPDHVAGLGFVGYSLRAFYTVALALSTMLAGRVANVILHGDGLSEQLLFLCGGMLAAVVLLFSAPLLVFSPLLVRTWRLGALEYSALANRIGSELENSWLGHDNASKIATSEKDDFSTTFDLYGIVEHVYALKYVPIDTRSIAVLAGAVLLPFVPVVLLAVPLQEIVEMLRKILF